MSTIKVDTIATRTGSGNVTVSNDTVFSTSVLVGKTSSGIATEGIELRANDDVMITQSGDTCLYLNRLSSDGSIVDLRKDGTTVGTVGANASRSFISGPQKGIKFGNASADPCTNTGAAADNSYDLGGSSIRYKDLYLSGGAYIGGTGAANKLDDFEEGSFVPILKHEVGDALTVGYASGYTHGRYTKIGTLVTFQLTIDVDSVSGGASNQQLVVPNLPFTAKTYQTNSNGGANMTYIVNLNTNITYGIVLGNSTTLRFYSAPATPSYGNTVTSSTHIQCYGQYETAS